MNDLLTPKEVTEFRKKKYGDYYYVTMKEIASAVKDYYRGAPLRLSIAYDQSQSFSFLDIADLIQNDLNEKGWKYSLVSHNRSTAGNTMSVTIIIKSTDDD